MIIAGEEQWPTISTFVIFFRTVKAGSGVSDAISDCTIDFRQAVCGKTA